MKLLPQLQYENLLPTRNYLQDICLAIGAIQRGCIPAEAYDWQHGLEIGMRGIVSQEFEVHGVIIRISLDMVTWKVRIGDANWSLEEYAAPEIFKNLKLWLQNHGHTGLFEQPGFSTDSSRFNQNEAQKLAAVIWWMDRRFTVSKSNLKGGLTAPILFYAHHFDLILVWFPDDDIRQISIGFSTGDETVPEPYIYGTVYPDAETLQKRPLVNGARWQTEGFTGLVLPYAALQVSQEPETIFDTFTHTLFTIT